jgi:hypothetical protein
MKSLVAIFEGLAERRPHQLSSDRRFCGIARWLKFARPREK